MNCDSQSLTDAAKCIAQGIPPGMQMPVLINLLCQMTNNAIISIGTHTMDGFQYAGFDTDTQIVANNMSIVNGGFTVSGDNLQALLLPALTAIGDVLSINGQHITMISLGNLANAGSSIFISHTGVSSLDLHSLISCNDPLSIDNNANLQAINLSAFTTAGGHVFFNNNNSLLALSLPLLTNIGSDFNANNSISLKTVSFPNIIFPDASITVDFSFCALDAASVNHILARCRASNLTNATIKLNGGTNATPTGQGATDKAALIAAGCTVTTN